MNQFLVVTVRDESGDIEFESSHVTKEEAITKADAMRANDTNGFILDIEVRGVKPSGMHTRLYSC